MTLLTASRRNAYAGSGITGPYAFGFPVFLDSDLVATVYDANSVPTVLAEGTDYSIAGVGQSSGSITLTADLAIGNTLILERVRAYEQTTDIRNQGAFFPETFEKALDSVVMLTQQLRDKVLNAFSLPTWITPGSVSTSIANFVAGYYLRVNLFGTGIEGVSSVIPDPGFLQSGSGAVAQTANAKMAVRVSVRDFGATGDGSTDDAGAIQRAITAARALGIGTVWFDPGVYKCLSGFTVPCAITFTGDGFVAGGTNASANYYATLLHDFSGDFFTFTGADGNVQGSGGGFRNLRMVQTYGTPATTGGVGAAIKLVATSNGLRPAWVQLDNVRVEEVYTVNAPWTNGLVCDNAGFTDGAIDIFVNRFDTHVSSTGGTTGAVRINGIGGEYQFSNCTFSQNGDVWVGDTSLATEVSFFNVYGRDLHLAKCSSVHVFGGTWSNFYDTADTSQPITLIPGRLVNPFGDVLGGAAGAIWYDGVIVGYSTGAWRMSEALALRNARYLSGVKTGGGALPIVGVNGGDVIQFTPNGDPATFAGPVGFNGTAAPAGKILLATGASHTADDIITVLQTLGLCKQS